MIEVRFSAGARGRLWELDELPRLAGPSAAKRSFQATRPGAPSRGLAIEVAIPRGGVTSYGLLGAAFTTEPGDTLLTVSILSGNPGKEAEFDESLASIPERPLVGLPEEYVQSVLDGFLAGTNRIGSTPSGSLTFNRAAHGILGSSRTVFDHLAASVTRLVWGDPTSWEAVIQEEFGLGPVESRQP